MKKTLSLFLSLVLILTPLTAIPVSAADHNDYGIFIEYSYEWDIGGSGTGWNFDPNTLTLTLSDYRGGKIYYAYRISEDFGKNLTVVLQGDNVIDGCTSGFPNYDMYLEPWYAPDIGLSSIVFRGDGSLTMNSYEGMNAAMYTGGSLFFTDSCEININAMQGIYQFGGHFVLQDDAKINVNAVGKRGYAICTHNYYQDSNYSGNRLADAVIDEDAEVNINFTADTSDGYTSYDGIECFSLKQYGKFTYTADNNDTIPGGIAIHYYPSANSPSYNAPDDFENVYLEGETTITGAKYAVAGGELNPGVENSFNGMSGIQVCSGTTNIYCADSVGYGLVARTITIDDGELDSETVNTGLWAGAGGIEITGRPVVNVTSTGPSPAVYTGDRYAEDKTQGGLNVYASPAVTLETPQYAYTVEVADVDNMSTSGTYIVNHIDLDTDGFVSVKNNGKGDTNFFSFVKRGDYTEVINGKDGGKYSTVEEDAIYYKSVNKAEPLVFCYYNTSHDHIYDSVVTDPTCTEKGYTTHTCTICSDSYIDSYVNALGHDYVGVVTEPTETSLGYTTYTCSRCGDSYVDDYTSLIPGTLPVNVAYENDTDLEFELEPVPQEYWFYGFDFSAEDLSEENLKNFSWRHLIGDEGLEEVTVKITRSEVQDDIKPEIENNLKWREMTPASYFGSYKIELFADGNPVTGLNGEIQVTAKNAVLPKGADTLLAFNEDNTYAGSYGTVLDDCQYNKEAQTLSWSSWSLNNPGVTIAAAKAMELSTKPIDTVEISKATLSFKAGDKVEFTGETGSDLYELGFNSPYTEEWRGSDGRYCKNVSTLYSEEPVSDEFFRNFANNTTYTYSAAVYIAEEAWYDGYYFTPDTKLILNGEPVTAKGIVYDSYSGSKGQAIRFENLASFTTSSVRTSIAKATVTAAAKTYTGKAITPKVEVKLGKQTLTVDKDYTVKYTDSSGKAVTSLVNAATYNVIVTGINDYYGTAKGTFTINPAAQTLTVPKTSFTKVYGDAAFTPTVKNSGKGSLVYASSDKTVATVTNAGKITIKGVGTAKITVYAKKTANYKKSATKTVTIKVLPAATSSVTAANLAKGIKVGWKKVTGAKGYYIYRNNTKIKDITSGSTVSYTDTKANTNGTKYVYKVVAYAGTGTSTLSNSVTVYRVSRPAISSLKNTVASKMTVKWGTNAKGSGYKIQYSTAKNFSSKKTVTITNRNTASKVISSLTKGRTYYVRIRTYKSVSGKKYYSAWGATKSVKITK